MTKTNGAHHPISDLALTPPQDWTLKHYREAWLSSQPIRFQALAERTSCPAGANIYRHALEYIDHLEQALMKHGLINHVGRRGEN